MPELRQTAAETRRLLTNVLWRTKRPITLLSVAQSARNACKKNCPLRALLTLLKSCRRPVLACSKKKQQVANDADSDSVSAAQKYYNLRKTDLNNAAQACGINPSTMPQLTDYFKSECPQVNLVGNTFSNSLGGIFSSSSVLGQAVNSQVSQVNALPEYGCIGVIAKSNQPKFNEMSSRIQAITNDEPAFCNCQ